jgi:hypothetical protein
VWSRRSYGEFGMKRRAPARLSSDYGVRIS